MVYKNLKVYEPVKKVGLILVMTGNGKGKTTSALGIALRAAGYNMRVCIIEFMKGDMYSGEFDGLKRLHPNVELFILGKGFCWFREENSSFQEHKACAQEAIKLAKEKILSGKFDIIILDEINNALHLKLIDIHQVIELIDIKPPLMHLVLTGRDAHPDIIQRAHTVTEMKEIKHAFRMGIEPQKGIDY